MIRFVLTVSVSVILSCLLAPVLTPVVRKEFSAGVAVVKKYMEDPPAQGKPDAGQEKVKG